MALKQQGVGFNDRLLCNRAFHNPNIATKMLEFVGVNEHGTNLPPEIYDPNDFPVDADYEAIGRTCGRRALTAAAAAQRSKWEESSRPANPQIAPPYLHVPSNPNERRAFAVSKRHQQMVERFYSRDAARQ